MVSQRDEGNDPKRDEGNEQRVPNEDPLSIVCPRFPRILGTLNNKQREAMACVKLR